MSLCPCLQITSSSVGINPIQGQYDGVKITQATMMLATYDRVDPNEPVVMTHAQTFDGRCAMSSLSWEWMPQPAKLYYIKCKA